MTDPVNDTGNEVVFDGVSKSFGQTQVLRDLDLRIGAGELVAVLGPSGCGKTTALRILAGFERPTSGRVLVNGRDLTAVPANKRGVGMVFQAYSLFPNLSVQDNVEYGPRVRRVSGSERARRAVELLEMCELGHLRERYPHELSGGQQQRVALARALAIEPRVLLLDEPLSALDAIVRTQIREEIRRLQRQLGITTMFVTHDQEEALSVADRVAVLKDGLIEQIDEPQTVYSRPSTHFVATFVGSITELGVEPSFTGGELVPVHPRPGLDSIFVRPEDLVLAPSDSGSHVVTAQTFTGERTVVRASVEGDRPDVTTSVSAAQAAMLPVGARVSVSVTTEPALRIPAADVPRDEASVARPSTVDA